MRINNDDLEVVIERKKIKIYNENIQGGLIND